ncbi:MAG: hypothetical protein JSV23_00530 [Promethearchaeota archaeon]|nr:MAG: hypothetical protein JSV23_00530 [Candidatus Lokiarchaeota archaeon]
MAKVGKTTQKSINISKGIIFTFLLIYLIIFGIIFSEFIDYYQQDKAGELAGDLWWGFATYIPLLCYLGALFSGIGFIIFLRNATTQKVRETQSRKKIKSGSIYKQALFVIIFIFVFIPLFSPLIDQGKNDQNFSVYNDNWNGGSDFKRAIENDGYDVMALQSSLSANDRLINTTINNKLKTSILLILFGPNQFYDPIFEVPYFIEFFKGRNSLLICHDHGSTSTLLWEIMIAGIFAETQIPITIFPDGILRDNSSYDTTPEFPIIKSFNSHPTTTTPNLINQVILSRSSCAAGGEFITAFGWDSIGSTTDYGFIDKDDNGMYNSPEDDLNLGFMNFLEDILPIPFPDTFPLGGYSQHVFLAKDSVSQRIFVSADASLFNNELINEGGYDNMEFGINIIEWLTYANEGVNKDEWIVVFDEAHIRPEYSRDLSSAGIFGFIMQYIVHLSTNPITAWIYPLLAFYSLRRYLPKKDKKKEEQKIAEEEEKKEEMARFRTSSFFAQKIEEYKDKMKYGDALKLLYRRLERKLNSQLRGEKITTQTVIDMVIAKDPSTTKLKTKRLSKFMDRILAIKEGKYKVKTDQDFEEIFFEMGWAVNNI